MLTNTGLVQHVKMALNEKWGYVWGTFGNVLTPTLFTQKLAQYPEGVGAYKDFITNNWLNKRTADCVGLIKSYLWWTDNGPEYNPMADVTADGMYNNSYEKGTINSFPIQDMVGLCVWKKGHIGVYIGDGQVIEANSTKRGVIQTPLKGEGATEWTHWLRCPYITYIEGVKPTPEKKTYVDIIQEVSDGSVTGWLKGIAAAKKLAEEDSNLGDLEIFKFLPQLIEKIYNKK